mgnify:CR=1 FL=1
MSERLKQTLRAFRNRSPAPGRLELLSHEWARDIDVKVESHDRQLKLLNATMLTALIADIVTRLLKP